MSPDRNDTSSLKTPKKNNVHKEDLIVDWIIHLPMTTQEKDARSNILSPVRKHSQATEKKKKMVEV